MSDAVSDAQPQSSLAYGWLTVGLLTIAYIKRCRVNKRH